MQNMQNKVIFHYVNTTLFLRARWTHLCGPKQMLGCLPSKMKSPLAVTPRRRRRGTHQVDRRMRFVSCPLVVPCGLLVVHALSKVCGYYFIAPKGGKGGTQRGRLWTACGQRCVDSKNSQTTPATTSTTSISQLLGATDAQMAHHATSSTAPAHKPLGSANVEMTPAGARAAVADGKPTQHTEGRTRDCPGHRQETTTRQNVTQGGGGRVYFESAMFCFKAVQELAHNQRVRAGRVRAGQV